MTVLAPLVALFYGDNRMTLITVATALPLFLGSLAALPLALMNGVCNSGSWRSMT